MPELIDAKGLGCAEPVILAKKALESSDEITVAVNEPAAMENLGALGTYLGCFVEFTTEAEHIYTVHLRKKQRG